MTVEEQRLKVELHEYIDSWLQQVASGKNTDDYESLNMLTDSSVIARMTEAAFNVFMATKETQDWLRSEGYLKD